MKRLKQFIIGTALMLGVGLFVAPAPVEAVNVFPTCSSSSVSSSAVCGNSGDEAKGFLKPLINTLLFIVGVLAVIMIIVGGIMYVLSAGDSNKVSRAKNMIIYSVVGLVVAFLAYAIVNWVLGELL